MRRLRPRLRPRPRPSLWPSTRGTRPSTAACFASCAPVSDGDAAQDVTAEAFARALARWDRVGVMAAPSAWVYRVAVNLARRRASRSTFERRLLGRAPRPAAVSGDHQAAETWDAVRALPPRQRLAVVLRYVEDLPENEIAAVMGVSPGTVAATLHAARQRLAQSWSTE